jgi:hypothetical protein
VRVDVFPLALGVGERKEMQLGKYKKPLSSVALRKEEGKRRTHLLYFYFIFIGFVF